MAQPVIEMKSITKIFGKTVANDNIDLHCNAREVLCILGENGAGKTTLMNILYGSLKPDSGEIRYKGERVVLTSPREAIDLGIQMVHQHFMLVPRLSVADNVVLGKEPKKNGLYDRKKAEETVEELSKQYGLIVNPRKAVAEISVGEKQRVEIIKALYQGAQVLILDEPTAVLTPQEVSELFNIINVLRDNGKSVIMITHKLKETMVISDRIYVLRKGAVVGELGCAETNIKELSELMVGGKLGREHFEAQEPGKVVLDIKNLTVKGKGDKDVLSDITLNICEREVLGIAGVEGNGQMELIDVLSGLIEKWKGEITFLGSPLRDMNTAKRWASGISYIFADRQTQGAVLTADLKNNYLLSMQYTSRYRKRGGIIDWGKVQKDTQKLVDEFDVRPNDISTRMGSLSGGNQQKFVVARALAHAPKLLMAALPTRGVDIKATTFIHEQIMLHRQNNGAVLLISTDIDEIMELSDRIAVMYSGQIMGCKKKEEVTIQALGKLMGGGTDHE
jgi:simple sugar transport system ATP-binding protein